MPRPSSPLLFLLLLLLVGCCSCIQTALRAHPISRRFPAPRACSAEQPEPGEPHSADSPSLEATQKRLKMVLLEQEGRARIARRAEVEPIVQKDLEKVRKYGGVSGCPGIMMGPPDLSS
mmetsp:Transcript_418/g.1346  ORF Transcript_418/g.1346 Transcript_418/m.1346 type:complete len:119 (+) Transcript_418:35-391(+)|eukprot:scaffold141746_cov31-Tisochrysis_lutea.AAC.1